MPTSSYGGLKWSNATKVDTLPGSAALCGIDNGRNVTITVDNFLAQYPDIGELIVEGDGTPVLEIAGAQYKIRSLESTGGIDISVGPSNNIQLRTSFQNGVSGGVTLSEDISATPVVFRTIQSGPGIGVSAAGDVITISSTDIPPATNQVQVYSTADLPTAVAGFHPLESDTVYRFLNSVDLGVNGLLLANNTSVTGASGLTTTLTTASTEALFKTADGARCAVESFDVQCPSCPIFVTDNTAPKSGLLYVARIVTANAQAIGTVQNMGILNISDTIVTNVTADGLTIQGTNSIINVDSVSVAAFTGTLFNMNSSVNDILDVENTVVISSNSANKIIEGLPNSGNISADGTGTFRAVNVFGQFTSSANILPSDDRWNFIASNTLPDSQNIGSVYLEDNPTDTTIVTQGVPVKVAGVFTIGREWRFSADATGKLTYTGAKPLIGQFSVTLTMLKIGSGIEEYTFYIYKNGAPIPGAIGKGQIDNSRAIAVPIVTDEEVITGDEFELFVSCDTDTDNVNVSAVNFQIVGA